MKIVEFKGHTIELYDDPELLSAERYNKFTLYCMIDAGIGDDLESVDGHLSMIYQYLNKDMKDKALLEIDNLRTNFHFIIENISPSTMAFAVLVKTINGKKPDGDLHKTISKVNRIGLTRKIIKDTVNFLKKKLKQS